MFVSDTGHAQRGLLRNIQFRVTDGARSSLHLVDHVLGSAGVGSDGPIRRFAASNVREKFRAGFRQEISKNIARTFSRCPVHDLNRKGRKPCLRIQLDQCRIVPGSDFPKIDVCQYRAGKMEFACRPRQIVDHHNPDQDRGKFDHLVCGPF